MKKAMSLSCVSSVLLIVSMAAAADSALAQEVTTPSSNGNASRGLNDSDEHTIEKGANEFGVWAGGSFNSPTLIGTAEDRKFLVVGLQYGRVFKTTRNVAFEYTVDAVPLAVVFQPDEARRFSRNDSSAVYGFGVMPVGFKFIFNRRGKIKPFAGTSGGLLYFREPVPIDLPGATRLNFAFDFSAGLQIPAGARRALNVGYKFHHISNGSRSDVNPGLDGNVFYVGYSLFR